jgi:hypothetical protein
MKRSCIEILASSDGPLTARAIARELAKGGYPYDGRGVALPTLSGRVSSCLAAHGEFAAVGNRRGHVLAGGAAPAPEPAPAPQPTALGDRIEAALSDRANGLGMNDLAEAVASSPSEDRNQLRSRIANHLIDNSDRYAQDDDGRWHIRDI